jgi:GNAT superfamily N-acetyltransferase
MIEIRPVVFEEALQLASLWHSGWHDAHAAILPEALVRARTLDDFARRIEASLASVRAAGPRGAPQGFTLLTGDELNQLYVSAEVRGTGIAAALIADAEEQLAASDVETGWLACAIGNNRAARFYEKSGWRRAGTFVSRLETMNGPFELEVWRYEKQLAQQISH